MISNSSSAAWNSFACILILAASYSFSAMNSSSLGSVSMAFASGSRVDAVRGTVGRRPSKDAQSGR